MNKTNIANSLKEVEENMRAVILNMAADKSAPICLKAFKSYLPQYLAKENEIVGGFRQRLFEDWECPLNLLKMQLFIARDLGSQINDALRRKRVRKNIALVEAVTRLHARACHITSEVIYLLEGGYADGAMARWRSLHEIVVTLYFIEQSGGDIADRYLAHDVIESYKAANGLNSVASRLKESSLSPTAFRRLENKKKALLLHYGEPFYEQYGWAAGVLNKVRPNFAHLEEAVSLDHLRPYYKLASHNVHANAKGLLFKLGLGDMERVLLVGPSNFGLADPGQNTAISLLQITAGVAQLLPRIQDLPVLKAMESLTAEISGSFVKVQRKLARAEKKLFCSEEPKLGQRVAPKGK
jgi:hypothetical protein